MPTLSAEGAADFFSQLGQKDTAPPTATESSASDVTRQQSSDFDARPSGNPSRQNIVQETISRNTNWDEGSEGIIKQNLLIGELEYAAQVALKAGRSTEALLIAEAGGQDLYD